MAPRVVSLAAARSPLARPAEQLRILNGLPLSHTFEEAIEPAGLTPLASTRIDVLQINVGKLCNQTCRHCHVDAGPDRRESMSRETIDL